MIIAEWKNAYRMFSVQATAAIVAWLAMPVDMQTAVLSLLPLARDQVTGILAVVAIIGRLVAQPKVHQ